MVENSNSSPPTHSSPSNDTTSDTAASTMIPANDPSASSAQSPPATEKDGGAGDYGREEDNSTTTNSTTAPHLPSNSSTSVRTRQSNPRRVSRLTLLLLQLTLSPHEYKRFYGLLAVSLRRSSAVRQVLPTPAEVAKSRAASAGSRSRRRRRERDDGVGRRRRSSVVGSEYDGESGKSGIGSVDEGEPFTIKTLRTALRVFLVTYAGSRGVDIVKDRIERRGYNMSGVDKLVNSENKNITAAGTSKAKRAASLRLASFVSLLLLSHRLVYRFLSRLRHALLQPEARPFRDRNPRVASLLTARVSAGVGAGMAGVLISLLQKGENGKAGSMRMALSLYVLMHVLEMGFDVVEARGMWSWVREMLSSCRSDAGNGKRREKRSKVNNGGDGRPWWFGSWLLMPFACSQLMHSFVYHRDSLPSFGTKMLLRQSGRYVQKRPVGYPERLKWPDGGEVVDCLGRMALGRWPNFTSPILFPSKPNLLPPSLQPIDPIASPAHPSIRSLACATLHPHDPSCFRTFVYFVLETLPSTTRFFLLLTFVSRLSSYLFSRLSALRPNTDGSSPTPASPYRKPSKSTLASFVTSTASLNNLARSALVPAMLATGAVGTAWGCVCLLQRVLPGNVLATKRFLLAGWLAGLWAVVWPLSRRGGSRSSSSSAASLSAASSGRSYTLTLARLALLSLWSVGVRDGWLSPSSLKMTREKKVSGTPRRWLVPAFLRADVCVFVVGLVLANVVFDLEHGNRDGSESGTSGVGLDEKERSEKYKGGEEREGENDEWERVWRRESVGAVAVARNRKGGGGRTLSDGGFRGRDSSQVGYGNGFVYEAGARYQIYEPSPNQTAGAKVLRRGLMLLRG